MKLLVTLLMINAQIIIMFQFQATLAPMQPMGQVFMKTVDSLVRGTNACTPASATEKYVVTPLDTKLKVRKFQLKFLWV